MKASELRELTVDELNSKHKEFKEEFMRIRCNTVLSADSDVHQMKKPERTLHESIRFLTRRIEPLLLKNHR